MTPNGECSVCGGHIPVVRRPANWRQALWGGWTCPRCSSEFDGFGRLLSPTLPAGASDPGGLAISPAKLRALRPDLYGFSGWRRRLRVRVGLAWDQLEYLDQHLRNGDARAAVVVSIDPLLAAAYTDELDGVAVLEFPAPFVEEYGLRDGSRLLSVNTYTRLHEPADDVVPGPKATGRWNNFNPIIADFVSDDVERIKRLKAEIPADEWQRAYELGRAYITRWPNFARDGRPIFSSMSANSRGES